MNQYISYDLINDYEQAIVQEEAEICVRVNTRVQNELVELRRNKSILDMKIGDLMDVKNTPERLIISNIRNKITKLFEMLDQNYDFVADTHQIHHIIIVREEYRKGCVYEMVRALFKSHYNVSEETDKYYRKKYRYTIPCTFIIKSGAILSKKYICRDYGLYISYCDIYSLRIQDILI
jgi:hypothetical protein